ncbi:hypothetical protein BaRGS_00003790 [Batillaria attramentaria]|uniref:Uncharacterized protein n=1 Tax=Batillaria attramentaria TaxID=370345 RepID=A0ABD0M0K4_9CAEN
MQGSETRRIVSHAANMKFRTTDSVASAEIAATIASESPFKVQPHHHPQLGGKHSFQQRRPAGGSLRTVMNAANESPSEVQPHHHPQLQRPAFACTTRSADGEL